MIRRLVEWFMSGVDRVWFWQADMQRRRRRR